MPSEVERNLSYYNSAYFCTNSLSNMPKIVLFWYVYSSIFKKFGLWEKVCFAFHSRKCSKSVFWDLPENFDLLTPYAFDKRSQ